MDSKNCKMLLTALETGSLTAAAERLGYTPSGVSRAIETLEKQAGFPIIKRTRRGVMLTREGKKLLPTIKEFVRLSDTYDQQSAEFNGLHVGTVAVGTAYANFYPWLAHLLLDFHEEHPGITMRILEGTSSELTRMVDDRQLDFGLTSQRKGNNRWIPLVEDELVAIVPRNHRLASKTRVNAQEFAREPFIELHPGRESDNSLFMAERGITPNVVFSTNDSLAMFTMVGAGMGISLINGITAKHLSSGIISIPLEPPCRIDCGVITPTEEEISLAARRFFEFAMSRKDQLPR